MVRLKLNFKKKISLRRCKGWGKMEIKVGKLGSEQSENNEKEQFHSLKMVCHIPKDP